LLDGSVNDYGNCGGHRAGTDRQFAKALNVAPFTVQRWQAGSHQPGGLQEEIILALYNTAMRVERDGTVDEAERIGSLVGLGIGALIYYLLDETSRPRRET
jgi:hypothetical protein